MAGKSDKPVFGRFSREDCGLPPLPDPRRERLGVIVRAVVLLAVLVVVGWLAGRAVGRYREAWLATLPGQVYRAQSRGGDVDTLLAQGRIYAMSQPERPESAAHLAMAVVTAAENAPRRLGYYGSAAAIHDELGEAGRGDFASDLSAAVVYSELGDFQLALERLARADAALAKVPDEKSRRSLRLLLVNTQAYLLATDPSPAGRNPEKALHLAQLLISSRDELPGGGHASDAAAFLDTLASAWQAAGDPARALTTQNLALGLAETAGLDVYIRHYDEFAVAANR